jgi:DUF4097 and DUF4098 domain-containing protein YvlB
LDSAPSVARFTDAMMGVWESAPMVETMFIAALGSHLELRITARSGRVVVHAEERTDVAVIEGNEDLGVSRAEHCLSLSAGRSGSSNLEVRCPLGTNLTVGTGSGRVQLHGTLGAVRVTTASGRIELEEASVADLRSASGDIHAMRCSSFCRVQTASGRADVGSCGSGELTTQSGRVLVGQASGRVRVCTASGGVDVGGDGHQDMAVQTISGSVRVRLPRHVRPATHLYSTHHTPRCELEAGDDCRIAVQSMHGKIEVVPAE